MDAKEIDAQYKPLYAEKAELEALQRIARLNTAQHRRMAELLAAVSAHEGDPHWVIARAQQALAHAALADLTA
ncbi:hypothetical protein [Actinomadura litoris]|uniref:hypothetical protein n=1 Tax=Actinomadura litoris TaxID=2678616 RepID=UPI001FA7DC18|nr:hypothetical protein [Actinomadura litoris]